MGREKIRHLFKKNHIEIFKVENPEFPIPKWPQYEKRTNSLGSYYRYWGTAPTETKIIRAESPLGFYYDTKVTIKKDVPTCGVVSWTIVTFPAPGETNTYYQLKYVTVHGDNGIGGEDGLRPWDIYPGDKDFPDNMLKALIKEVDNFFSLSEAAGFKFSISNDSSYGARYRREKETLYTTKYIKNDVYTELFGNPKGPRFQTNEEKILAHGFDLKYSFRKDKEKK